MFCLVDRAAGVVVEELFNGAHEELGRHARVDAREAFGEVALDANLVAELREDRLDVAAGAAPLERPKGRLKVVVLRDRLEVHAEVVGEGQLDRCGDVAFVPEHAAVCEAGGERLAEHVVGGQIGDLPQDREVVVGGGAQDVFDVDA